MHPSSIQAVLSVIDKSDILCTSTDSVIKRMDVVTCFKTKLLYLLPKIFVYTSFLESCFIIAVCCQMSMF
jgi:hypothetical protein